MRNLIASAFLVLLLTGCAGQTCKDTITEVPVATEVTVKAKLPDRPISVSSQITATSSQDDVVKAALIDLTTWKIYATKLENLLK